MIHLIGVNNNCKSTTRHLRTQSHLAPFLNDFSITYSHTKTLTDTVRPYGASKQITRVFVPLTEMAYCLNSNAYSISTQSQANL